MAGLPGLNGEMCPDPVRPVSQKSYPHDLCHCHSCDQQQAARALDRAAGRSEGFRFGLPAPLLWYIDAWLLIAPAVRSLT